MYVYVCIYLNFVRLIINIERFNSHTIKLNNWELMKLLRCAGFFSGKSCGFSIFIFIFSPPPPLPGATPIIMAHISYRYTCTKYRIAGFGFVIFYNVKQK